MLESIRGNGDVHNRAKQYRMGRARSDKSVLERDIGTHRLGPFGYTPRVSGWSVLASEPSHSFDKRGDDLGLDVSASGGLYEEVCERKIVGRDDHRPIDAIAIEGPSGQQQCGPLVCLTERLCPCDPMGENGGCDHWIFKVVDCSKGLAKAIDVVRFVEPFVLAPDRTIDSDRQLDRRSPQCSRR
jgi:hypothetical protein